MIVIFVTLCQFYMPTEFEIVSTYLTSRYSGGQMCTLLKHEIGSTERCRCVSVCPLKARLIPAHLALALVVYVGSVYNSLF